MLDQQDIGGEIAKQIVMAACQNKYSSESFGKFVDVISDHRRRYTVKIRAELIGKDSFGSACDRFCQTIAILLPLAKLRRRLKNRKDIV